jgi:hypothetical protein
VAPLVLLVVLLGEPEAPQWLDARRDLSPGARLEAVAGLEGGQKLLLTVRENQRGVLGGVRRSRGVVRQPEGVEKVVIADDLRVEVDLERLGVVAEAVVGGGIERAAGIADPRAPDTFDEPEPGIRSPESTRGKGGRLKESRDAGVEHGLEVSSVRETDTRMGEERLELHGRTSLRGG